MNLIAWAFIIAATIALVRQWTAMDRRLDRDLPRLLDDPMRPATTCEVTGHKWTAYANYRLCLTCGDREEHPYDQDLDSTDLQRWEAEL